MLQTIYNNAIASLNNQKDGLDRLIEENTGSEVGDFIQRVLVWYQDKDRKQLLWEVFHQVFDLDPILFMGSFGSFVANCLLDDSAFRVEYRKLFVDGKHDLVWEKDGYKTVLSTKDDPKAEPVVIRDNDGTQKVALLMEAMDHAEFRHFRRIQENEELQEKLRALKGK